MTIRKGTIADYRQKLDYERELVTHLRNERTEAFSRIDKLTQEVESAHHAMETLRNQLQYMETMTRDEIQEVKADAFDLLRQMMGRDSE